MPWPLFDRLPLKNDVSGDLILDRFLDYIKSKNLDLYPAQEEAILEVISGKNLILNTPTGSGKSLVASALHFDALARGHRSIYTSPIKALVNEKFFALCRDFGPDQVGMITGDATVNPGAPIICCTAEILMNDALRQGEALTLDDVVMDEFHYYSDRERGVAWQVPLLCLPQVRFLLMSATIGDTAPFEKALTELNQKETVVIRTTVRPVPLDFQYSENPLHDAVSKLIRAERAPIYLVSFSQRECAERAQDFLSIDLCTKEEKKAIAEFLVGFKFSSPYGKEFQKFLRHGMGIHHGGLLPKYRVLVESMAQKSLLKIIFGTDTLGVGVNVPIRSVLLTQLCKYDGQKTNLLSVRDFQQISGRAGRKGFDDLGTVVAQAPEHVIENLRNEQKAEGDPKKLKKLVKRKPPEKGYVPWTNETFQKLIHGQPESLVSRFKINHAMILNLLSRPDESGCKAAQLLIRKSHESDTGKKKIGKHAFQLFRSLVDRKIVELSPLRVNVDLQEDFSLNHALSLYLVDTLKLLDFTSEDYVFDVLTLIESILENPEIVLRKQLDLIKTEKMGELKAQGMEFDERIAELEKLEYPKPNREFIYDTFNRFAAIHPWIGEENIRPKSIAREMYENFHSFGDYIREYDLHRAEGALLHYLSDFYKALVQNVPDVSKNDELFEVSVYFKSMIRAIDSSLIDEWEKMRDPVAFAARVEETVAPELPVDITRDKKAFTVLVRNIVFIFVRALSVGDYETANSLLQTEVPSLEAMMKPYYESEHSRILTDVKARNPQNTQIQMRDQSWEVTQVLTDPEEHNDWSIQFSINIEVSRTAGVPILQWIQIGSI